MEGGSPSPGLRDFTPGLWLGTVPFVGPGPWFWPQGFAEPVRASQLGGRPQEGSFHPPRGPTAAQRLWEEPGLPGQPFPKFQFLLINIISAPVQVNKLTLSDEPAFLPAPNDVILTGSDLCRSLFPGGTEEGWDLTDRGQEAVALTLLFDGYP